MAGTQHDFIGVISDTHGLIRPEALDAIRGSTLIIHAGDIGSPDVLDRLRVIAPVVAVRGNNDRDKWAEALPEMETIAFKTTKICVLHDLKTMTLDPARTGVGVVISGHSHRPLIEFRDEILFLNPGSAGPRRFRLPITVARLEIKNRKPEARLIELLSQRGS